MSNQVKAEGVLNDDCTAVTLTIHDIPLDRLADTLATLGHPSMIKQWVDGMNAQIPIKKAGGPETRKVLKVL